MGRSAVVLKWAEVQLPFGDVNLVGALVEAAGVSGGFDVVAAGGGPPPKATAFNKAADDTVLVAPRRKAAGLS